MLNVQHLRNCYDNYRHNQTCALPDTWYLGYMEACLIQFGVVESKDNGLMDYAIKCKKKFLFWEYETIEDRRDIVVRLTKEFLAI